MNRNRIYLMCVLVFASSAVGNAAQPIEIRVGASQYNSSVETGWANGDTYTSETDDRYGEETYNPTTDERRRMRIEWGKPSLGYVDYDLESVEDDGDLRALWVETDELRPDRELLIRGRLLLESPDGKSVSPATWVQGVNVVVARRPRVRLDWSQRQHDDMATDSHCVVEKDGQFHVPFPIGEILRTPGREEPFQVGLSLGIKEGKTITWKNTVPVLPQSVSTIHLPGPPVLSPTQRIVNGADPSLSPLGLVRAVNHLQALGKERAIAELRTFAKTAPDFPSRPICVPENIDTADATSVDRIVLLLFEPADETKHRPHVWHVRYHNADGDDLDPSIFPHFPLVMKDDLPFLAAWNEVALGGQPPDPQWMVDWAAKHGKLRSQPLAPGSNPFDAAEDVLAQLEAHRLSGLPMRRVNVLDQAWSLVMEVCAGLPPARQPPEMLLDHDDRDPDWPARKAFAATLQLNWNADRQVYDVD